MSWKFTDKQAKDAYEYILTKRSDCKRSVFDIEWLDEWLEWLSLNKYLFTNYSNKTVDGVITIFPIERCKTVPTLKHIICNVMKTHKTRDYFIMDALVDNPQSRVNIINKILKQYPEIDQDQDVQLLACRKGKVTKLNKSKILTLKN